MSIADDAVEPKLSQLIDAANENHVNDGGLLKVLNARATLVVRGQGLSDELKAAFQTFVDKVEENWL